MKKMLLFPLLFIFNLSFGQVADRIKFTYDDAGNQTRRYICLGCQSRKAKDTIYKTPESLTENDFLKDDLYSHISYYPNPVREELYVKWQNTTDIQVSKIELYSMSGQFVKNIADIRDSELATIEFQPYPEGFYNLILVYSNGDKKTLRIVKKQ